MSTAKSTTTKPSSASARAQRHANRSTSAPPSETHAPTAPQAHASLPVIQEGSVTADAGIQPARSACEHSVIDIDAADAPTTTAAVATTTAAATQIVHEHSVIDTDTTEDPTVAPAHPERTHSVIDVDGNEPPAQEKGMEVDTAPTYATATSAGLNIEPAHYAATAQPPARTVSFPLLPIPGVEIQSPPASKGKGKMKSLMPDEDPDASSDEESRDPTLARDMAAARALSLGQQPSTTPGASSSHSASTTASSRTAPASASSSRTTSSSTSSSRRPVAAPGSPPKRARANTVGDTHPTMHAPSPRGRIPNPAAMHVADPFNPPRVDPPCYHTEDGLPPRGAFTPAPPGGWRPIFGIDSESVWRNHPTDQREMWDHEPHPKFLAIPSGGNGDRVRTQRLLANTIADFLNISLTRLLIGPPGENAGSSGDARAWLISGLPQDLAHAVLDERQLASEDVVAYFFPYAPPIAGYLLAFTGFTLDAEHGGPAVQGYVADAISRDSAITQFVRAHRDALPAHVNADEAVEIFIASIGVDALEITEMATIDGREVETRYTIWNVYAFSPTDNVQDFNALRRLVGNLRINTTWHGQGKRYHNMDCRICPGIDHTTETCTLPDTPGWLGATPATIKAREEASRAARAAASNGGNGGGRGRGSGRGGRGKQNGRGFLRGGRGRGY